MVEKFDIVKFMEKKISSHTGKHIWVITVLPLLESLNFTEQNGLFSEAGEVLCKIHVQKGSSKKKKKLFLLFPVRRHTKVLLLSKNVFCWCYSRLHFKCSVLVVLIHFESEIAPSYIEAERHV